MILAAMWSGRAFFRASLRSLTPTVAALFVLSVAASSGPEAHAGANALAAVQLHRYCMGTMFDIVAYHPTQADAQRAIERAMAEIERLDRVMSNFKPDSDLSRLVREGRNAFTTVEPSLFEVIQTSLEFSQRSSGRFDVTIAPLLRTWKDAAAEGRRPSDKNIAAARRCVGFEKIEMQPPNRIRFNSDCLEIDLGGIGKGYAVDRAIGFLKSDGIRSALINAGASSIASIGAPPGENGWPVQLGARVSGQNTLLLRDSTVSTSQQKFVPLTFDPGAFGDILDPRSGGPADSRLTVTVVAPTATMSDALSTTLLILSPTQGATLLQAFDGVSALWIAPNGMLHAGYRDSLLQLSNSK
jgi:FAD:protein FMN transferase